MAEDISPSTAGAPASNDAGVEPSPTHAAGRSHVSSAVAVEGSIVREGLSLTPHQLGELTRRLGLKVGGRPNYPRYSQVDIRLLIAVQTLRELQVPVEDSCATVAAYRAQLAGGPGWLIIYPDQERWVAAVVMRLDGLASLLALAGRAAVVDLEGLRRRSDLAWLQLLSASKV